MRSVVRRGPVAFCLLTLGAWALPGAVPATTLYKWVDAQGVVHYSDTPHEGAEKIQISGAQTFHSTPVPSAAAPNPAPGSASTARYSSCSIVEPANDAGLYAPESVAVTVQTTPALQAGDTITASVDGQSLGTLSAGGAHFQIPQPERGTHTVTAVVRDSDGTVQCTASPVSFSVQRPSVNAPQSPVKPH